MNTDLSNLQYSELLELYKEEKDFTQYLEKKKKKKKKK